MSPESREWPPYLRRLAKLCLFVIYTGVSTAGFSVVFPLDVGRPAWSVALGGCAALSALTACLLMLIERWMEERAAANLAGLFLAVYAFLNTVRIATADADPAATGLIYVAVGAVGLRAVHLSAFDFNLNRAKAGADRAHRPQAL